MVILYKTLAEAFAPLSIKAVLQKALFASVSSVMPDAFQNCHQVALTARPASTAITYQSAIALQLAAQGQTGPLHAIAEAVARQTLRCPSDQPAPSGCLEAVDHWTIQTHESGWMTLTLTPVGIIQWLQQAAAIAAAPLAVEQALPIPSLQTQPYHHPLSQRLQISLPLLLQFCHCWCCNWLSHLVSPPSTPSTEAKLAATLALALPFSEAEKPYPLRTYGTLLPTVIQVTDRLAQGAISSEGCLKQAGTLAEAVYTFQAAVPIAQISRLPPGVRTQLEYLFQIARLVLALIIVNVLQQDPAEEL